MMLKRNWTVAALGIALALRMSSASAAFLTIIENGDDAPTVDTNLIQFPGVPVFTTAPETATIDGFHFPLISPSPVALGTRAVELLEPGTDIISDLIVLTAGPITGNCPAAAQGECQELTVNFNSDVEGGPPLDSLIPPNVIPVAIQEDGTLQDISDALGTLPQGLIVQVQSDLDVPEPASVALLTTALLGLARVRRRRG